MEHMRKRRAKRAAGLLEVRPLEPVVQGATEMPASSNKMMTSHGMGVPLYSNIWSYIHFRTMALALTAPILLHETLLSFPNGLKSTRQRPLSASVRIRK